MLSWNSNTVKVQNSCPVSEVFSIDAWKLHQDVSNLNLKIVQMVTYTRSAETILLNYYLTTP